jgi:hypothetical protein
MSWFKILKSADAVVTELEELQDYLEEEGREMELRIYEVGDSVMSYAQDINSGALAQAGSALRDGNADDAMNGGRLEDCLETIRGIEEGTGDPR